MISFLLTLLAGGLLISPLFRAVGAQQGGEPGFSDSAKRQIQALLQEKQSRSPAKRKISSQLLQALKVQRGEAITMGGEVRSLRSASALAEASEKGPIEVDIKGRIDRELIKTIENLSGEVLYHSYRSSIVRARVSLASLEDLAALPDVRTIRPAAGAVTHRQLTGTGGSDPDPIAFPLNPLKMIPPTRSDSPTDLTQRATNIQRQLSAALARAAVQPRQSYAQPRAGIAASQGDTAHRAADARHFFGITGAGVKVGVLSGGHDIYPLAQSIATGDLPPDVVVLGQFPPDEGSVAMLEIIHDLAPDAKLFFTSAITGLPDRLADSIRALRAAGCDIIVEDPDPANVNTESPFHDDVVSAAIEEVIADGALFFSAVGSVGNFNDGTSGTWEGDFKDSGTTLATLPGGTLHDFGDGVISNVHLVRSLDDLGLWWSDPFGASGNDYDIFVMDNALTTVLEASTDVQDGDDDPFETVDSFFMPAGARVLIFKADGAEKRALHLSYFRGGLSPGRLGISTPGAIRGHNSAAGSFTVAAVDVAVAGGGAFTGGPTNPVQVFGSDGFRRVFFKSDGTPFTPGNLLFSTQGGDLRRKPDLSAADGVITTAPGFAPFFGATAAASHAAAAAALLKSAKPLLTSPRIRQVLTQTALDIEATGLDRDSGAGIVDAFAALQLIGPPPAPFLELGTLTTTPVGGDGDNFIEPGEGGTITAPLANVGGATALNIRAALTTSTPGVTITSGSSSYPDLGSNGDSATNSTPFSFTLANTAACGLPIELTLTVNYANSNIGPLVYTFRVQTGQPETGTTNVSYAGPPVPIPDNVNEGINIPIVVNGLSGPVNDLKFSFDGSSCTRAEGATTVGLDHFFVSTLLVKLTSPQGTTVTLMTHPGGFSSSSGGNFCQTLLDDSATALIQQITNAGAPYTGTFKPANPLAAFNGENGNGTWILNVADTFTGLSGSVRAFSLVFSTFSCSTP
jgi:subtilisin-like proprotein convertase family protein